MTEDQRQRLSVLVDDEAGPRQASRTLDELLQDAELRACWERYHLIGSVLRGDRVSRAFCQVSARLSGPLGQEPTILAPRMRWRGLPRRSVSSVGAAVAAAALLTVVVVPQWSTGPGDAPQRLAAPTPAPATAPVALADLPVDPAAAAMPSPGPRWQIDEPALESKLDRMLVSHQESATASGIQGLMSYAALVGYGGR